MADDIVIRIKAIDEATKTIKQIEQSLGKGQRAIVTTKQSYTNLNQALKITGLSQRKFNEFARINFMENKKGVGMIDKLTGQTMAYGVAVKQATLQGRRFKFEWLSIMFAGMALDRAFGGLVRTQMQVWGVSEGLASMWTVVMAPIMDKITPLLWKLIEAFMNMPEPMQKAIGAGILFLAGLGMILTVVGQVMLAFMGFKILGIGGIFTKIGGAVKGVTSAIAGLSSVVLAVVAVIVAVVIGMYLAWKENFMNMKQTVQRFFEGIKQMFQGFIQIFSGIFDIIRAIFTGDVDLLIAGFKKVFQGLWKFLTGGFKAAFNLIKGIITGALKIIINIVNLLLGIGGRIGNLLSGRGWTAAPNVRIPSFQAGGIVPMTGPALLHAGERVIPKGRNGGEVIFSPTVYITSTINNEMDIRSLATKLNEYWVKDFERIAQTRGI